MTVPRRCLPHVHRAAGALAASPQRAVAGPDLLCTRDDLFAERLARLGARQRRVTATNRMIGCTDASQGVVPRVVWDDCEAGFWEVARVVGVG